MLSDAVKDVQGEVDVQVTEENNAAAILREQRWHRQAINQMPTRPEKIFPFPLTMLTSMESTPACRPAERSKFPVRFKYWYLRRGCTPVTTGRNEGCRDGR